MAIDELCIRWFCSNDLDIKTLLWAMPELYQRLVWFWIYCINNDGGISDNVCDQEFGTIGCIDRYSLCLWRGYLWPILPWNPTNGVADPWLLVPPTWWKSRRKLLPEGRNLRRIWYKYMCLPMVATNYNTLNWTQRATTILVIPIPNTSVYRFVVKRQAMETEMAALESATHMH